jgi:hypothetical protein
MLFLTRLAVSVAMGVCLGFVARDHRGLSWTIAGLYCLRMLLS